MLTVYSDQHRLQNGSSEFVDGRLQSPVEKPARADMILAAVRAAKLGEVIEPRDFGTDPILRVHDPRMVAFLETAWEKWVAAHGPWDALPGCILPQGARAREPEYINGKIAFFATDPATPITSGTWDAARSAVNVALTGMASVVSGARAAFALCRPPGHHASRDHYGGFCFFNNAAVAAQRALDGGATRVATLDVDYHHGNGTQSIFYDRGDVLCVSLHANPSFEYPYFYGFADETGDGAGRDCNYNLPLAVGTQWREYEAALTLALARIRDYSPDVLVVSLGVDTFEHDPLSRFKLASADFSRIGAGIAGLGLPTLFVMEGGYAIDELGSNTVNALIGFEGGRAR